MAIDAQDSRRHGRGKPGTVTVSGTDISRNIHKTNLQAADDEEDEESAGQDLHIKPFLIYDFGEQAASRSSQKMPRPVPSLSLSHTHSRSHTHTHA